ncbi:hypothetical protein V8E54_002525 [Elaphomyces granulatus]
MAPYRKKPTWAILPSSKSLPGSKALELLGCVVADIENPTDHRVPTDAAGFHKQLPKVLEVEDTDMKTMLNSTHALQVEARLAQIFGLDAGRQSSQQRQADAQSVITRFLVDHPRVFKTLVENSEYHQEILEMMDWNPVDKKTAYMVVGVKSCLDTKVSEIRKFDSHMGGGTELPLDAALAACGVPPTGVASLDTVANTKQSNTRDLLSTYTAVGERIFAVQYRQIKRHRDWLRWTAPSTLRYCDLEHVSNEVGLFGDSDEEEYEAIEAEEGGEEVVDDAELEVGEGLQAGTAVGNLLLADL